MLPLTFKLLFNQRLKYFYHIWKLNSTCIFMFVLYKKESQELNFLGGFFSTVYTSYFDIEKYLKDIIIDIIIDSDFIIHVKKFIM